MYHFYYFWQWCIVHVIQSECHMASSTFSFGQSPDYIHWVHLWMGHGERRILIETVSPCTDHQCAVLCAGFHSLALHWKSLVSMLPCKWMKVRWSWHRCILFSCRNKYPQNMLCLSKEVMHCNLLLVKKLYGVNEEITPLLSCLWRKLPKMKSYLARGVLLVNFILLVIIFSYCSIPC